MPSRQTTYVCSHHFITQDYSHGTHKKILKEDALPTVFNKENKDQSTPSSTLGEVLKLDQLISPEDEASELCSMPILHAVLNLLFYSLILRLKREEK
jgi:hypothetical protein